MRKISNKTLERTLKRFVRSTKSNSFNEELSIKALEAIDSAFKTDFQIRLHNNIIGFHNSRYRIKESEIALIHIPKTGGTSLHKLLQKDKQSRFINLNIHRPISKLCCPKKYRYITVMREPAERVWSYYQMILSAPVGFPYKSFANRGLEFFLQNCWEVQNMACRYYSGEVFKAPSIQTLQISVENLENFEYIINFNTFERDVSELLSIYDIQAKTVVHKRKSNYGRLTQADRQAICKYNSLDLELFNTFKNKFFA